MHLPCLLTFPSPILQYFSLREVARTFENSHSHPNEGILMLMLRLWGKRPKRANTNTSKLPETLFEKASGRHVEHTNYFQVKCGLPKPICYFNQLRPVMLHNNGVRMVQILHSRRQHSVFCKTSLPLTYLPIAPSNSIINIGFDECLFRIKCIILWTRKLQSYQ